MLMKNPLNLPLDVPSGNMTVLLFSSVSSSPLWTAQVTMAMLGEREPQREQCGATGFLMISGFSEESVSVVLLQSREALTWS